jgi:type IV conjugative transfer system coupling protein TraD
MRGEIDNFTRGSQLLSHKFLMFKSGFGLLMLLHLGLTALTAILFVVYNSTEHERYLAMMRGEALGWQWMELDPTKAMWIETAGGGKITLTWAQAVTHPVLQRGWQAVMDPLWSGIVYGSFAGVILVAIGWYVSKRIGLSARQDKEQRGAHLTSRKLLIKELKAHNLVQFSASLKTALKAGNSWLWWLQFPFVTRRDWQKAGEYWPHSLADVPFPWGTETFHTMACGTTGSGKTTLIMDLIAQARNKQQRAVIFDLTGGFIGPFYDPARDIILNPQDARCPTWSVFNDADDKNGFRQMAHAIVPHDGGTSEPFWVEAARTLFVEACLKLQEAGHRTNASLGHELMTVPLAQVEALLANTIAAPFTSTDAARMAESVRSTLNINAEALLSLPTDGRPFSIRKWIEEDGADGFLFLATRPNEMETNRRLITVWMNLAIQGMMSGRKKRTIDTWFIFDEVGALHRLPALEAGLQTSRNFGGAFILGVHAYDKIADVYGDKMATVISSLTRTKVILSTADRKTAEWCSDFIGKQQYREMEEGVSYGYSTMRDAVTLTARLRTEPLVLPDTITNLPSLHGYIKFPEGFPAAPIKLQYVKRIDHAEPFMHRDSRPGAPGTDLPFEGQNRPGEGSRTTQPHAGPTGQTRKSKETGKKKSAGVLGLFEGRQEPVFETDAGDEARPKSDHDVDPETGQLGRAIAIVGGRRDEIDNQGGWLRALCDRDIEGKLNLVKSIYGLLERYGKHKTRSSVKEMADSHEEPPALLPFTAAAIELLAVVTDPAERETLVTLLRRAPALCIQDDGATSTLINIPAMVQAELQAHHSVVLAGIANSLGFKFYRILADPKDDQWLIMPDLKDSPGLRASDLLISLAKTVMPGQLIAWVPDISFIIENGQFKVTVTADLTATALQTHFWSALHAAAGQVGCTSVSVRNLAREPRH